MMVARAAEVFEALYNQSIDQSAGGAFCVRLAEKSGKGRA